MKWSSALLFLLAPGLAHAGACCVGATSGVPTRVGECETWLVGLGVSYEHDMGRWDDSGAAVGSSLSEDTFVQTLGAGYRWNRQMHVTAQLPVRATRKANATESSWGFGPGDLSASVWFDPWEESSTRPRPVLQAGVRAPTGRSWDRSSDPLGSDITGLPDPAVLLGANLERTTGSTPYAAGVSATLSLGDTPHLFGVTGSVGRYLGTRWTALGTGSFQVAPSTKSFSARTSLGGRVVHGAMLSHRVWAGAETDLPISGLGRNNPQLLRVGVGAALLR